ncbi:hypothetical protein IQ07DRAFT_136027 [Pyrenochaeta sp. DS3sAY3a]|nr:hypothetical protein IQ07DRAFT_136027 [Pyrenochaeta sp. DS3sAY3a]
MPPKKLEQRSSKPPSAESPGPSEAELKDIAAQHSSPESALRTAASNAEKALAAQKQASSLRAAADAIRDPKKREKYLTDAYNKEIEAHGNSKKARVLSSGAFQGSVGGGGIGMAVGAGLGTVVGTIVGTVATIPTTGGEKKDGKDGKGKGNGDGDEDKENHDSNEKRDEKQQGDQGAEFDDDDDAVLDPALLRQAADEVEHERKKNGSHHDEDPTEKKEKEKERKKPRKIEVRNQHAVAA